MTNAEIIERTKMLHGLDCEAHTYAAWNNLGYKVKKGEKAAFKAQIWNISSKKDEEGKEVAGNYYKKWSHFFTIHQVEKIE